MGQCFERAIYQILGPSTYLHTPMLLSAVRRQRRAGKGMGEILAGGSRVRVGFAVAQVGNAIPIETIKADLEGCLYNTGQFYEVTINFTQSWGNDYIQVDALTADDFATVEDFGGLVAQQLQWCAPALTVYRRDAVAIDARPANRPDAAAPRDTHGQTICPPGYVYTGGFFSDCSPASGTTPPKQPGKCDRAGEKGIIDYLACQSGVSKEQGLLVGILLLVAGVVVVKKII
jgi:hypothetical protein